MYEGEVGMTTQEAVRILNEQRNIFMSGWVDFGAVNDAYNMAIALLKEQEPVPPDVDSEETCSCGNCGTTVGYYPVGCKTPEKLCKFCPECGRAVKWDAAD